MFAKIKHMQTKALRGAENLSDMRVVGLLLFLVIVLMISWSGARAIETNYQLQKQIAEQAQQNRVQALANENLRLQNQYFETEQYLDIAARQHFGLSAEGETVLIVPQHVALRYTAEPQPAAETDPKRTKPAQPAYQRNFQAWMDFFLHRERD
jgi:cell division protein FtsB